MRKISQAVMDRWKVNIKMTLMNSDYSCVNLSLTIRLNCLSVLYFCGTELFNYCHILQKTGAYHDCF